MTTEEKNILLKDLCARLPYKPIVHVEWDYKDEPPHYKSKHKEADRILEINDIYEIWNVKPYLRPMLSMTEEERTQMTYDCYVISIDFEHKTTDMVALWNTPRVINWLLEHHFDFMELIPKGLAIKAPGGMYIKN